MIHTHTDAKTFSKNPRPMTCRLYFRIFEKFFWHTGCLNQIDTMIFKCFKIEGI